jgi:hypothetical protein
METKIRGSLITIDLFTMIPPLKLDVIPLNGEINRLNERSVLGMAYSSNPPPKIH